MQQVDDDALKNLDWKPLVGQYLVRSKHVILRWLEDRERVRSRVEVLDLQDEIAKLAPPLPDRELLPPGSVPIDRLLADIELISIAVSELRSGDSAELISAGDATPIEKRIRISSNEIADLLTQETITTESEMTLLVKKPDYLGHSMWEFRSGDQALEAKMLDRDWLERFREGRIALKPGDALRAVVRSNIARGFEGNIVDSRHEVLKVLAVVLFTQGEQDDLLS